MILGAGLYVAIGLAASAAAVAVPDSVRVGVPFLFLPILVLRWAGQPWDLGGLNRTLAYSAAVYAPFAVWLALGIPTSPQTYAPGAAALTGGAVVVWWSIDTFFHVGAVDYITKRVVQHESAALFGERRSLVFSVVAWSLGHVVEWLWLRAALGEIGAAAFLVLAGIATAMAYARWKNVLGLMIGHFLLNVAVAAAAVVSL